MQIMGDCSNLLVTKAIENRFLVEHPFYDWFQLETASNHSLSVVFTYQPDVARGSSTHLYALVNQSLVLVPIFWVKNQNVFEMYHTVLTL